MGQLTPISGLPLNKGRIGEILCDSCRRGRRLRISARRPAGGRLEISPVSPHNVVNKLARQSYTSCWAPVRVSQALFSHCQECVPLLFFKEVHPSALGLDENDSKVRRKCVKAALVNRSRRWPFRMKVFCLPVALPHVSLGCVRVAGNSLWGR